MVKISRPLPVALALAMFLAACQTNTTVITPAPVASGTPAEDTAAPSANFPASPDPATLAAFVDAGFPIEAIAPYTAVTTEVLVDEPGHVRYRQHLPATSQDQVVEVRVSQLALDIPQGAVSVVTADGLQVYPMLLAGDEIPGGYFIELMVYLPPGELSTDELVALGLPDPSTAALGPSVRLASWTVPTVGGAPRIAAGTGPPGVVVQGAVAVGDAGGASGIGDTFIRAQPEAASSKLGFWDQVDVFDDSMENTTQFLREQDFQRKGIEWQTNELRIARENAAKARFNTAAAAAIALWDTYRAVRDWWNTNEQLAELEHCNKNPAVPIQRDQADIDATQARIDEVRGELRINNAIRAGNIITGLLAAKIPGPAGMLAQVLSSIGDAMLEEDANHITSGLSGTVAGCVPTYVLLEVHYQYSYSWILDPPQRDALVTSGMVSEVFDVKQVAQVTGVDVAQATEWGAFRHTEVGVGCAAFTYLTEGLAASYVDASQNGFATAVPGEDPHPAFDISVAVAGTGLLNTSHSKGYDRDDAGGHPICAANQDESTNDGTVSLVCHFAGIDIVAGGLYFDDSMASSSSPTETERRTCRVTVRPLYGTPTRDPSAPAPPPAR